MWETWSIYFITLTTFLLGYAIGRGLQPTEIRRKITQQMHALEKTLANGATIEVGALHRPSAKSLDILKEKKNPAMAAMRESLATNVELEEAKKYIKAHPEVLDQEET